MRFEKLPAETAFKTFKPAKSSICLTSHQQFLNDQSYLSNAYTLGVVNGFAGALGFGSLIGEKIEHPKHRNQTRFSHSPSQPTCVFSVIELRKRKRGRIYPSKRLISFCRAALQLRVSMRRLPPRTRRMLQLKPG